MPKLSVIVPVYNTEKYLRECVDSILAQTFTDFELILVNDGSTDGSGAICDEYALKDPRVRVIHQENGGVTRARKAAMRIAAGSWISFVDSDDWISPVMFDTMIEKATGETQIVICDAYLEFPDRSEIAGSQVAPGVYDKAAMMQRIYPTMIMDFDKRCPGMTGWLCNKLFERSLLEKVFWSVEDHFVLSEDALCTYAALLESDRIYIFRNSWYHYRQHMGSAMHQYHGEKRYRDLLKSYQAHEKMLNLRAPVYLEQLQEFIAVNAISNLRNVLLFDQETPLLNRVAQAKNFLRKKIVVRAFQSTIKKCCDRKERFKICLALHKCVMMLYWLFTMKQMKLERIGAAHIRKI